MSGAEYDNAKQKTEIVGEWVSEGKQKGYSATAVSSGQCSKAWPQGGGAAPELSIQSGQRGGVMGAPQ